MLLRSSCYALCLGLAMAAWVAPPARAAEFDCGELTNAYGPYDYINTDHRRRYLPVVENHHFDFNVETLSRGKSGSVLGDLDYTLRAFPNHHRALRSMARYQLKNGRPSGTAFRSVECYFDRAKRLNPRDAEVYAIHGWYLHQRGDLEAALIQYREAEKLKTLAIDRDYHIGMLLFDMKRYAEARQYAERAYRRKYPDDELRERLKQVNHWPG